MSEEEEEEQKMNIWCLTHSHWWYPHEEQLQAPEGMCYCCGTKKPCDCEIISAVEVGREEEAKK